MTPALFLVLLFVVFGSIGGGAIFLRWRTYRDRLTGWEALAAQRGLQIVKGDPLGLGPRLSGARALHSVERTVSGTVEGVFVAVILTVAVITWADSELDSRTGVFGLARVGEPVPVDRLRQALRDVPHVQLGALGDMVVLEPLRGLRLTIDVPPADEVGRLLDLAAWVGRVAASPPGASGWKQGC